jgi:hypothetical protein
LVRFSVTVLALAATLPFIGNEANAGDAAKAADKVPCESSQRPGGRLDVACPLPAAGAAQRFRFKANFSGGHDDTMASMTATLDDRPLACDAGGKTRLQGEDGDVSLECLFAVEGRGGAKALLKVAVSWSHAEYQNVELAAEK